MKLIYISEYYSESIIYTQVFALLNHYIESGLLDEIIFLAGIKYHDKNTDEIIKRLDKKIKISYYKHYPDYPAFSYFTQRSLMNALKKINGIQDFIIHVRSLRESYHVYSALKKMKISTKKIIADIRGATYEETLEYSIRNKFLKKQKLKLISQSLKNLSNISNVSCVSNSLKAYLENKLTHIPMLNENATYAIGNANIQDKKTQVFVNSCLATNEFAFNQSYRESIRKELDLKDNEILLVLSSGGNGRWQNTENTINQLYNKYKVLNLSKSHIDHPNVINKFVSYNDVPKYLCAADVAVVWREPTITNKVASPVKFSEFVCCGLPVITNNSIELIRDYVLEHDSGLVLNSLEELNDEKLKHILKIDRNLLSQTGRNRFNIDVISQQYINLYKNAVFNSLK